MTIPPDLITSAEAARILSVNPATLARWAANGTLAPVTKLAGKNGAYLFAREHVERFAAERAA